jgi:general secretion pathway protein E
VADSGTARSPGKGADDGTANAPGPRLGERLVAQGRLSPRDVERALLAQAEMGDLFGRVLVKLGLVSESDVARVLSEQLAVPLLAAADYPETLPAVDGVALEFLVSNNLVPISVTEQEVTFAAAVPQDPYVAKALAMALERRVRLCLGTDSDIARHLEQMLAGDEESDEDDPAEEDHLRTDPMMNSSSTCATSPARRRSSGS